MKALLKSIIVIIFIGGCTFESDRVIKEKLLVILEDDLNAIVEDVPEENLLDSIYYEIVLYKEYKKESFKYSKKAVVDFYFLKMVKAKVVRKYRYVRQSRKWDRYYNEYKFFDFIEKK
jgi:hypothetical protein